MAIMDDHRWQRLQYLFRAASERDVAQRQTLLDEECCDDGPLRREIESMLAYEEESEHFIESSALEVVAQLMAEEDRATISLTSLHLSLTGKLISHYRILEKLGDGGMGVVYKAHDTKLNRFVALKFLLDAEPDFCSARPGQQGRPSYDRQALKRIEREARASSALDHPNICTVYEIDEYDGSPFIAMQFLSGHTLKHEISGHSLAAREVLDLGIQIADAFITAHSAGIVHRDIKPANIFVTSRREVKVLDFGLAKITSISYTSVPEVTMERPVREQPHRTAGHTIARTDIGFGTVSYMSPEQVLGEEDLDHRSDIFSLGVVLYEMATGLLPWRGETPEQLFEEILYHPPAFEPQGKLAPELKRIIGRAISKERETRYQSALELRGDLEALKNILYSGEGVHGNGGLKVAAIGTLSSSKRWLITSALLLAAVVVAIFHFQHHQQRTRLTDTDTIVVADFTNTTGDPVFDATLKQGLRVQLAQSPFLNLLSESKEQEQLRNMMLAPDTKLDADVAREVCIRSGSKAMVAGLISSLGSHYVLGLDVVNCQTGDSLATEQVEAANRGEIVKSLTDAATRLRSHLGESIAGIKRYDVPLEQATPSLDALRAYSLGIRTSYTKDDQSAIPYFKRAIELDPNFAAAYVGLGNAYYSLTQVANASAAITKAYELRDRASDAEKLDIDSHYYMMVTGELKKAIEVYKYWQKVYPRELTPYTNAGLVYSMLGQQNKNLDAQDEAMRIDPNDAINYLNLANAHQVLNQFGQAQALVSRAHAHKLDDDEFVIISYLLAFLTGDTGATADNAMVAIGKPGYEDLMLAQESNTEAYYGRLSRAREFTRRAIVSARSKGEEESASGYQVVGALREADVGNLLLARKEIAKGPGRNSSQVVRVLTALALARSGEPDSAATVASELGRQYPLDTLLNNYWIPTIRASVALDRGNPSKAIELLTVAKLYDLSVPQVPTTETFYPTYVRGMAYLATKQGSLAAQHFQEILTHSGIIVNYHLRALALLGLGRSYALEARIPGMTDSAKQTSLRDAMQGAVLSGARDSYQDFFHLWKDADSAIPILRQARAEYRMLQ